MHFSGKLHAAVALENSGLKKDDIWLVLFDFGSMIHESKTFIFEFSKLSL